MLYEYECEVHGVFELDRSMAEWASPGACPSCAMECRRILSRPNVAQVSRASAVAHARNERSAHEPALVKRTRAAPDHKPALSASCGGARPWMLGH